MFRLSLFEILQRLWKFFKCPHKKFFCETHPKSTEINLENFTQFPMRLGQINFISPSICLLLDIFINRIHNGNRFKASFSLRRKILRIPGWIIVNYTGKGELVLVIHGSNICWIMWTFCLLCYGDKDFFELSRICSLSFASAVVIELNLIPQFLLSHTKKHISKQLPAKIYWILHIHSFNIPTKFHWKNSP